MSACRGVLYARKTAHSTAPIARAFCHTRSCVYMRETLANVLIGILYMRLYVVHTCIQTHTHLRRHRIFSYLRLGVVRYIEIEYSMPTTHLREPNVS